MKEPRHAREILREAGEWAPEEAEVPKLLALSA